MRLRVGLALAVTAIVTSSAGCGAAPRTAAPRPSPSANPARSPGASLDPTRLTRGPDPRISWYDVRARTLHHGARTTRLGVEGTVESVAAAGSVDLLVVAGARDRDSVVRVDPDGSTTVVARSKAASGVVTVASDARTFAWHGLTGGRTPVEVVRIEDGHQVADRRFVNEQLRVLTLGADRALVSSHGRTVWWDLKGDTVAPLARDIAVAATSRGDHLALQSGNTDRSRVLDTSTGSSWSLPRKEVPVAFSTDGTRLLTGRNRAADFRGYDVFQQPLRVRDVDTGKLRATFDARFGWYESGGARWEDGDHFLAVARNPTYRSGDPTMRRSWVRCSVAADSCERAGPIETAKLDVPPYGPLERLVSGQLPE